MKVEVEIDESLIESLKRYVERDPDSGDKRRCEGIIWEVAEKIGIKEEVI